MKSFLVVTLSVLTALFCTVVISASIATIMMYHGSIILVVLVFIAGIALSVWLFFKVFNYLSFKLPE